MQDQQFLATLVAHAAAVEALLADLLGTTTRAGEIARPPRLLEAMRHGVLNGGKRLRPALLLESVRLFGGDADDALRVAAALECVHCYSLIHDDLPAMDDDDLRRGQPTVHKAFDEAAAILAGDSLLTYAFEILAAPEIQLADRQRVQLVFALAQASGLGGMAGGQALDLEAESVAPDEEQVATMQAMKTGALIRFACEAGAVIGNADEESIARMRRFGAAVGLAFQLRDDLLDITADSATMGKATGKDAARGKGTLPGLKGIAWTEARLRSLVEEAKALLSPHGAAAEPLMAMASYAATRNK